MKNILPSAISYKLFAISFFITTALFAGNHVTSIMGKTPSFGTISPSDTSKSKTDTDSDDDDDDVRSYAIGLNFGSDQSYHGLHSNQKLPYMEPNFTYTAPKGFYVETSVQDILVKKVGGFDALDFNPGWDIDLADNTTLNFNWSKYFFKANTPITIRQDLSDAFETYIEQWIGETKGKFSIDYDYYKKYKNPLKNTPNDWVLTPDLEHTFKITVSKKTSISIIPEGSVDFGTRNAFSQLQLNSADSTAFYNKTGQPIQDAEISTNSGFGTLDYTLILTINLKIGHFEFEPAFNYSALLYKPPGVPATPLSYGTIDFTYTIDHKVKSKKS